MTMNDQGIGYSGETEIDVRLKPLRRCIAY